MSGMTTPSPKHPGSLARRVLEMAQKEIDSIPMGTVRTDVMISHATKAQVFTQAATVHALLDIADSLRTIAAKGNDA